MESLKLEQGRNDITVDSETKKRNLHANKYAPRAKNGNL